MTYAVTTDNLLVSEVGQLVAVGYDYTVVCELWLDVCDDHLAPTMHKRN